MDNHFSSFIGVFVLLYNRISEYKMEVGMKNRDKSWVKVRMLAVALFLIGVFSAQSFAQEATKMIQTNDFNSFSVATAKMIKEEGSNVQVYGVRDTAHMLLKD